MILSPINLGFAGGNNLGIKAASGDYLFFVNSDIVIPKGTIQILLSTFAEYKNIGIISPKFYVYNQPNMLDYAGCSKINFITGRGRIRGFETIDKGLYDIPSETHYCHGGGMMIHNSLIEKVGLIPDPYFLYYEEMEWCEKIHRAGYKVFYQPKATLLHKVSTSIGSSSTTKTYYMTRNRILFMRRNRPTYIWVIFFLYFIIISIPKNVIYFLVKAQFKHLKYFLWAIIWNIGYKLEPKF